LTKVEITCVQINPLQCPFCTPTKQYRQGQTTNRTQKELPLKIKEIKKHDYRVSIAVSAWRSQFLNQQKLTIILKFTQKKFA